MLTSLHAAAHLVPMIHLYRLFPCNSCFTGQETEPQRGEKTYPRALSELEVKLEYGRQGFAQSGRWAPGFADVHKGAGSFLLLVPRLLLFAGLPPPGLLSVLRAHQPPSLLAAFVLAVLSAWDLLPRRRRFFYLINSCYSQHRLFLPLSNAFLLSVTTLDDALHTAFPSVPCSVMCPHAQFLANELEVEYSVRHNVLLKWVGYVPLFLCPCAVLLSDADVVAGALAIILNHEAP